MVLGLIAIVVTLVLVIGVHEAGHAWAARFFKVTIKRVAIGFGRSVFSWQSAKGVEWVWAMWPFGGSVFLLNSRVYPVTPQQYPFCFDKKPIWQRILILLAGPFANLVLAWLALTLVFIIGIHYRVPKVETVQIHSVAEQAGFKTGDQLLAIDKQKIVTWHDVGLVLVEKWGSEDVPVLVKRNDLEQELHLNLHQVAFSAKKFSLLENLGLKADKHAETLWLRVNSVWDAMSNATKALGSLCYLFLATLKQLLTGVIPFSALLGPLGFFSVVISSLTQGVGVFVYLIATISIAVAVVNLLPIPVLDGGSIIYALIEKVRKKPVSVALEILIHRLFSIAFVLLLVQLILNDFKR